VLNKIPVVIQLRLEQIQKADLQEELRIDKFNLEKELRRQPGRYMWWAALYSEASAKVELLKDKLDHLESKLFSRYAKNHDRVSDVKHRVILDLEYQKLKSRLRRWQDSERLLKYAEKAFSQRAMAIMGINANLRKEKASSDNE